MTKTRHDAMASVATACADEAEVVALSIIRMIAAGYATGDVACWDEAYAGAEDILPPEAAGALVASLTVLIRSLRAERSTAWSFLPATCCRVTRHEEDILRLLTAGRRGDPLAIAEAGSALTGAAVPPRLHGAVHVAGRALNEVAGELAKTRPTTHRASASWH